MKPRHLLLLLSLLPLTLQANGSFWFCKSADGTMKEWVSKHPFQQAAINHAMDECKKASARPETCTVSKALCEQVVEGKSMKPMWRCEALDQWAQSWPSQIYDNRDDAAIAAKAYCKDKSAMPDSCYINLLTCKNLNERS